MSRSMAKRVSRNQAVSQCPSQAQLDGQLLIREHIKQRVDGRRRVSIQRRQPQLMRLAGDNFQEHFRPVIDSFDAEPPDPIVILKNQRVLVPPIQSWNTHDPFATSRTNLRTRNQERESLFKQAEDDYGDIIDSDAQAERDIQNSLIAGDNLVTFSKILCISGHFGYLDLPHLPAFGSSRPPEYMAPIIVANLEVNLRERYFQYIERFINVKFEQQWFESKQIKRRFRTTEKPMATAAFRMRLRQIKNLFLDGSRVDLTEFANNQDYNDWNESIIVSIMNKFNVSRHQAARTISIINEYNLPLLTEFLDDDDLLNLLYPLECVNGLKQKLHDDPQSFLKSSIFISRYLELHESKPFNVIPLSKGNVPSFFPIDTRTLWSIIKNNVPNQQQAQTLQNQNLFDIQTDVFRYTPQQQNYFWSIFTNIGTGKLRKSGYTFNNIIHTDGFSVSVEFVRNDLVGQGHGKPDSASLGESDIYITDIEREDLVNRTIVTCDPGKRDMLYCASRKPIPLANNIRSFRHGFNSHRLPMCVWRSK
ncbi:hypothetical protein RCL1_006777 [Eukaryota sp. TZLM3-RCL]